MPVRYPVYLADTPPVQYTCFGDHLLICGSTTVGNYLSYRYSIWLVPPYGPLSVKKRSIFSPYSVSISPFWPILSPMADTAIEKI